VVPQFIANIFPNIFIFTYDPDGGYFMTEKSSRANRMELIAKLLFILIFMGGFAVVIFIGMTHDPGLEMFKIDALDLTLLALATYRLGRMIAYDKVAEPLRKPFTRTVPDHSGAGMTVIPKGEGVIRAFGQLFSCPICVGTWVAALLVYALYFFPDPARVFLFITAAVGGAELIHNATEAFCWSGVHSRIKSGEVFRQVRGGEEVNKSEDLGST
jgi:hypothetical protein